MTTALTNLYVRNIPMEWTAADLIKLGEKYGPVVSAKIMYNPLTTASRGMGFLRFAEHHDATLAIAGINGHLPEGVVHGKPLNVQFAKDQQVGGGGSKSDSSRYSPYPSTVRKPHSTAASPSSDASGAVGFVEELPVAPSGTDPLNVYVVDLPLSFTKEQFQALYEPFGNLVTSTVLSDPATNQSRGIGFARYSNKENAARALKETQGMTLPGATKPLLVRFAKDSSRKYEEQTAASLAALTHLPHQQPQPSYPSPYYPAGAYAPYPPPPPTGSSTSHASTGYGPYSAPSAPPPTDPAAAAAAYQAWAAYYAYYYPGAPLPPPPASASASAATAPATSASASAPSAYPYPYYPRPSAYPG